MKAKDGKIRNTDVIGENELNALIAPVKSDKKDVFRKWPDFFDNSDIFNLIKSALTGKINDRGVFIKGIDYSYYYEAED